MNSARKLKNAAMVRVDQAGEYGAVRIYAGQLAVLGNRHPVARDIAHMAEQEERHREFFDRLMSKRGVRPTLLQPFWNIAGFALGAASAAISPRTAMACTAAVETVIDQHYQKQIEELGDDDPTLSDAIAQFRAEELEHRDTAIAAGAENISGYLPFSLAIQTACRVAIALAKRL